MFVRVVTRSSNIRCRRSLCADSSTTYERRQSDLIAALPDGRPARVCFTSERGRHLVHDVASGEECRRAAAIAMQTMSIYCDSDHDGSRLLPPHLPTALPLLGERGFALFAALRDRVAERARARYGAVEPSNSLISWISGARDAGSVAEDREATPTCFDLTRDPRHGTYAPHVDQANQRHYDVSALLYLTTAGVDFSGGGFAFNDADCDHRLIEPTAGLLLTFPSGFDNLHQVRPVRRGERVVLSVWFTRTSGE